jgi:hypothetical protein
MNKLKAIAIVCFLAICHQIASGASSEVQSKNTPECSAKAICFSGEVSTGKEFRKAITDNLEFVLEPEPFDASGWTIQVVPRQQTRDQEEFAGVVTEPYRGHNELDINMGWGVTAEEEVSSSPREFDFVTNIGDYRIESGRLQIVLWPYTYKEREVSRASAKLGTSPLGKGRLWITDSKLVTHPTRLIPNSAISSGCDSRLKYSFQNKREKSLNRRRTSTVTAESSVVGKLWK